MKGSQRKSHLYRNDKDDSQYCRNSEKQDHAVPLKVFKKNQPTILYIPVQMYKLFNFSKAESLIQKLDFFLAKENWYQMEIGSIQ